MPLTIEYVHGHRVELVGADGTTIIPTVRLIHPGHEDGGISTVAHQVSLDTANDTGGQFNRKETLTGQFPNRTWLLLSY